MRPYSGREKFLEWFITSFVWFAALFLHRRITSKLSFSLRCPGSSARFVMVVCSIPNSAKAMTSMSLAATGSASFINTESGKAAFCLKNKNKNKNKEVKPLWFLCLLHQMWNNVIHELINNGLGWPRISALTTDLHDIINHVVYILYRLVHVFSLQELGKGLNIFRARIPVKICRFTTFFHWMRTSLK